MTKQKINIMELYVRNVKGVLKGVGKVANFGGGSAGTGIAMILYIGLLPLTLTLGAGIKSLIDFVKRKPLNLDQVNSAKEKLAAMTAEEVDAFSQKIAEKYPKPRSNSSKMVVSLLKDSVDEKVVNAEVEAKFKEEKLKNKIDHLKDEGISLVPEKYQITLNTEELEQVKVKTQEVVKEKQQAKTTEKQNSLVSFFEKPENAGKKLQQVICEELLKATPSQ